MNFIFLKKIDSFSFKLRGKRKYERKGNSTAAIISSIEEPSAKKAIPNKACIGRIHDFRRPRGNNSLRISFQILINICNYNVINRKNVLFKFSVAKDIFYVHRINNRRP